VSNTTHNKNINVDAALCWVVTWHCYVMKVANPAGCISVQLHSCTWHTDLPQKKQNLAFTTPLSARETVTALAATGLNHWNGESETAHFGTADLWHVPPLFLNRWSALHTCSAGSNIYGHHFIWQLSVATFRRLACRINVAHSSDFPPAWRSKGGKWQTIVVGWNNCKNLFTTAGNIRWVCFSISILRLTLVRWTLVAPKFTPGLTPFLRRLFVWPAKVVRKMTLLFWGQFDAPGMGRRICVGNPRSSSICMNVYTSWLIH
jgi:hypothetical protein